MTNIKNDIDLNSLNNELNIIKNGQTLDIPIDAFESDSKQK